MDVCEGREWPGGQVHVFGEPARRPTGDERLCSAADADCVAVVFHPRSEPIGLEFLCPDCGAHSSDAAA